MEESTVPPRPQAKAELLTDLMLAVFRVNGRLLEKGDQLVAPLNLTSARWQVLGAVALAGTPLSAPQIAAAMGITRQGAQKQLNKLEEDGFFEQSPNPRHQRSPVYALTELGNRTFANAMALESAWANGLVVGLSLQDLKNTLHTLNAVYELLDSPVPKKGPRS
jgi:DNA-binding MarR family transcriptional regulator